MYPHTCIFTVRAYTLTCTPTYDDQKSDFLSFFALFSYMCNIRFEAVEIAG